METNSALPRVLTGILILALGASLAGCDRLSAPTGPQPETSSPALSTEASTGTSVISGQYIVALQPEVADPAATARDLASEHGVEIRHIYRHALKGFAGSATAAAAKRLRAEDQVLRITPDIQVRAVGQTLPEGIDRIDVDQNTTASIGDGSAVDADIAILDTGIDLDHPDLDVEKGVDCTKGCEPGGDDKNGHGTHVAGIAAAQDNSEGVVGVAPGADLWAVKVLGNSGRGSLSDVIAGVEYVTRHGGENGPIDVANMSLGAQAWNKSFRDAVQNSINAGVVHVVAAGNDESDIYGGDGSIGDGNEFIPAAFPEAAAISALADSDGGPLGKGPDPSYGPDDSFADFSNFSNALASDEDNPDNTSGKAIDLVLPGVEIYSTYKNGGYETLSGTSMASPHAAGLAGLHIATHSLSLESASDVESLREALISQGAPQDSRKGLVNNGAPDGYLEPLGWAGSAAEDPIAAWAAPDEGATVSGSITLKIRAEDGASNSENVSEVRWKLDGAEQATQSVDGDGTYEFSWDTSTASNGDHRITAVVEDGGGETSAHAIVVTVDNEDDGGGGGGGPPSWASGGSN